MEVREDEIDNHSISSMDERKGCRSLLCDANGIIIAEMVYRCMICYSIHDYIGDVSKHYHTTHMNGDEDQEDGLKEEEYEELDQNCNNNNYLNDYGNNCDSSSLCDMDSKYSSYNEKLKPTSHSITNQKITNTSSESCTRSGYIHCPVCSTVRCYTTLQRRYGQFTCVACYRFFKEFFVKPAQFSCPYLGECALDVKSKCKACWILACLKVYNVDGARKSILESNTPIKSPLPPSSNKFNDSRESVKSFSTNGNNNSNTCSNENSKPKANHNLSSFSNDDTRSFNAPSLQIEQDFVNQVPTTTPINGSSTHTSKMPSSQPIPMDENCTPGAGDCNDIGSNDCDMMEENSLTMMKEEGDKSNGYDSSGTSSITKEPVSNGKSAKKVDRRSKARVKNWCCLKCANCLADDCGRCINCLDRPKFGGPFIRKQRCIKKKCLEKKQSEA